MGANGSRSVRKGDTRRRILAAAADLFASRGYAATSISAICRASKAAPSSVYWEFESKEDIFAAVLEESARRWLDESGRTISSAIQQAKGADFAQAYFSYMADALATRPEFLRLMFLTAVERRDGDEACMEIIRSHRRRAFEGLATLFTSVGMTAPASRRAEAHDLARFAVACFDGAFAAAQIDGEEADLYRMLDILRRALSSVSHGSAVVSTPLAATPRGKTRPRR